MEESATSQLTFEIEEKPFCQITLTVSIPKELSSKTRLQAIKAVAKEISLPGFRKGKAPHSYIEENYRSDIEKQWKTILGNEAFAECNKKGSPTPFDQNASVILDVKELSEEGSLVTFSFEKSPNIPSIDLSHFALNPVEQVAVLPQNIDEMVRQTLFFYAEWRIVEPREIKEGDFVHLSVDVIETDPPSSLFKDVRFEVNDKSMASWMKNLVLGKKPGDSVEGVSFADEDIAEKEKKFYIPQKVRITIENIYEPSMPEITPEFLQNLGVSSEEQLRTRIEELLNNQSKLQALEIMRDQASDYLINNHPFDIPRKQIQDEMDFRIKQLSQSLPFVNYWKSLNPESRKKLISSLEETSIRAIKLYLLSHKLIHQEKISIPSTPLSKMPETILDAIVTQEQMFGHEQTPATQKTAPISQVFLETALDFIIQKSTQA